jgi:hypothetical protein
VAEAMDAHHNRHKPNQIYKRISFWIEFFHQIGLKKFLQILEEIFFNPV